MMAPKRHLNPGLVKRLYEEFRSFRRVSEILEEMGIVNPRTGNPYSHMAAANTYKYATSSEYVEHDRHYEWEVEAINLYMNYVNSERSRA